MMPVMTQRKRIGVGVLIAIAGTAAASALMLPLRERMSVTAPALVLMIPVVAAVAAGGFLAGAVGVALSFLAYDFFFIRPYGTLAVATTQGWVALGVEVAVLLVVARVVAGLTSARAEARRREDESHRLLDLLELLLGEKPLGELLGVVVSSVRHHFNLDAAVLFLPVDGRLEVAARDGEELSEGELAQVVPRAGAPASLSVPLALRGELWAVTLVTAGRPVGLLAFKGKRPERHQREMLAAYAAHGALAIERAQLREQALRTGLLEEADRFRRALLGSVSHDLRTPLASIKASVSTLASPETSAAIQEGERAELLAMIEEQADHLARLVTNLLDMSRIEAGALVIHLEATALADIMDEALGMLGGLVPRSQVTLQAPADLPLLAADHTLVTQVLVNLLENAARHSPRGAPIMVRARVARGRDGLDGVEITVDDAGPGVPASQRESIFEMFQRREGGGRAGLGLGIAKAFVEAHGGSIRVDASSGGGASFIFDLPIYAETVDDDRSSEQAPSEGAPARLRPHGRSRECDQLMVP